MGTEGNHISRSEFVAFLSVKLFLNDLSITFYDRSRRYDTLLPLPN